MNYLIKDGKIYRKGTLAHYLDKRNLAIGEPTESSLPKTINPYKFVMENLLKNNCVVIKLKHSEMKYPTNLLSLVSELTPAEQAILFYIDVDDVGTEFTLNGGMVSKSGLATRAVGVAPIYMESDAKLSELEERCK